ncbi:MAG: hypothetical protein IJ192_01765 [Clostridia bacterium]|nr:hypothetical protein [Clostridia bacterium]
MNIENRLKRLERAVAAKPPKDLFGHYYDELPEPDKIRYMRYIYGSDFSGLPHAESIEQQAQGTLHFICESKIFDFDFGDTLEYIKRVIDLNL